jgi:capsule polysaccharide export protein KpsE/RkpR
MNPEIQALKAENAALTKELTVQGALLTAKIEEVGRLYEIIAILAGKKAQ